MSLIEGWETLRGLTPVPRAELMARFLQWIEEFTYEDASDPVVFSSWRGLNPKVREGYLRETISGSIIGVCEASQLEIGILYGLFQILERRRCVITSILMYDLPYMRKLLDRVRSLGDIKIGLMGAICGAPGKRLADCGDFDLALSDYFEFMGTMRRNEDLFFEKVQSIFLLEGDLCLYSNRILAFEHGVPRASGLVYKSTGKVPEEWSNQDFIDVASRLSQSKIAIAGSASRISKFTAEEINKVFCVPGHRRKLKATPDIGYTAFTFRTSDERLSAVVTDVLKCEGNAIVVACSDQVIGMLQEEFRKSGQPASVTSRAADILTFFQMGANAEPGKRVLIIRGMPSTLIWSGEQICKGAIFVAEHFISPDMHGKIFTVGKQAFEESQPPRLYFALEDSLFEIYSEDAGFEKLFKVIDFTEKYDHWKQIRRVFAKSMVTRLHRIRSESLTEELPLFTTSLTRSVPLATGKSVSKKKASAKMEAMCFCGSGKPFKECHGKRKSGMPKG